MDHRYQLRRGEPVQVTVLAGSEAGSPAIVASSCSESVELLLDTAAPPGAAVKVEGGDTLFLGEIYSCRPEGSKFAISVELQHALYNTPELARLAKRILDEDNHRR